MTSLEGLTPQEQLGRFIDELNEIGLEPDDERRVARYDRCVRLWTGAARMALLHLTPPKPPPLKMREPPPHDNYERLRRGGRHG